MVITIDHKNYLCNTKEDFGDCIRDILSGYSGEIWISERGLPEDLPCLGILTDEEQAVINYFARDGRNYVTAGDREKEGFCIFCDGQYEVHACQVIEKSQAEKGILAFYENGELPAMLQWETVSE